MLNGTKVKLVVFAPTLDNNISRPVISTISSNTIEYNDASFFDLNGDPYNVVAAQFDITGSEVSYRTLESGLFLDVNDQTGFNGYALTFSAIKPGSGLSIRAADLIAGQTTLGVEKSDVFTDNNTLFVNVDGLQFVTNDKFLIELGFNVEGNAGNNDLSGMGGRDALRGRAGNDDLQGKGGRDILTGGQGADVLTGGTAADIFQFKLAAESSVSQRDRITDFSHKQGDRIDVSDVGDFSFIGTARFSGDGIAELRFQLKSGDVYVVSGDTDGDGASDIVISVDSSTALQKSDFIL
ncbi:MAG: putative protease [Rhizobium sp.]|nr:putative protease [Rhizobium sp.]